MLSNLYPSTTHRSTAEHAVHPQYSADAVIRLVSMKIPACDYPFNAGIKSLRGTLPDEIFIREFAS
jgi:hypothetical protein